MALHGIAAGAATAALDASDGQAAVLVTTDTGRVAAFQSGAHVIGFDAIPGNGGGGSAGHTGTPLQPESQVTDQFRDLGVVFSSNGGSLGVVSVEGLPNEADAVSPHSVVGGSLPNHPLPVLNYLEPIVLEFLVPDADIQGVTSRTGAWSDRPADWAFGL